MGVRLATVTPFVAFVLAPLVVVGALALLPRCGTGLERAALIPLAALDTLALAALATTSQRWAKRAGRPQDAGNRALFVAASLALGTALVLGNVDRGGHGLLVAFALVAQRRT